MNFLVVVLSRRCGMVVNRRVVPTSAVLLANSAAVSNGRMSVGTAGLAVLGMIGSLKSPFRIRWPGNLRVAENLNGVRFHRRSYEPRKKVVLLPGTGPLSDPPSAFKL